MSNVETTSLRGKGSLYSLYPLARWVNICVSATHIEFFLCPPLDINTCLWNCPLTCRKPSCLSHVCFQMTTARVRATLTTGSKVSDRKNSLAKVRCYISVFSHCLCLPILRPRSDPVQPDRLQNCKLKHLQYARTKSTTQHVSCVLIQWQEGSIMRCCVVFTLFWTQALVKVNYTTCSP